jgi:hypothetical protein
MLEETHDHDLPENAVDLALLAAPPAIWFSHFLACYGSAAVWCARYVGPGGSLAPLSPAFIVLTIVAMAGIAVVGIGAYRRHRHGDAEPPHDFDSAADRHRFLGFATLLLAGLSLVATLFSAGAALTFDVCR